MWIFCPFLAGTFLSFPNTQFPWQANCCNCNQFFVCKFNERLFSMFNQLIRRFYLCEKEKNKTRSDWKHWWDELLWINLNPRVHFIFQEWGVPGLVEHPPWDGHASEAMALLLQGGSHSEWAARDQGVPPGGVCLSFGVASVLIRHRNISVRLSPGREAIEECC